MRAHSSFTPADQNIVSEELAILEKVAEHLYRLAETSIKASSETKGQSYSEQMIALRDQVVESRLEDVPALVAQMLHVAALMESHKPQAAALVNANSPYFAHLQLTEKGKRRNVLIGKQSLIDRQSGLAIVDWRHAPVSRLYYCYHEGDEFEEEFAGKAHAGVIDKRRSISIDQGRLKKIRCPQGTFVLLPDAQDQHPTWHAIDEALQPELKGGAGVAARPPVADKKRARLGDVSHPSFRADKHLAEITSLIDPAQFDAMTQPDAGVVVLQGGAGSGKTTILLHRIAYLAFANPQNFSPKCMLVVVFSEALANYVKQVLPSLDLHGVKVVDYRQWIKQTLRDVVSLEDRRMVDDAPSDVSCLKKHPGMLKAIEDQVKRRRDEFERELHEHLNNDLEAALNTWRDLSEDLPLAKAILAFGKSVDRQGMSRDSIERAQKVAKRAQEKITDLLSEWEELITDTELLAHTMQGDDALSAQEMRNALNWTQKQIETPDAYDHVDSDRKVAMDNRGLDDDDPIFALDPHDGPLLLNMYLARFGEIRTQSGKTVVYDHVAIDEAQDLSAVEVKPLYASLQENRSMTLAGDITQKVIFDNGFDNWSTLLADIDATGIELEPFRVSYRSSVEITEFSQQLLGPLKPAVAPKAVRRGAPVEIFEFDEIGEEIAFLAENLRNLMAHEREANVAILSRYPERADFYYQMLKHADVPFLRRAQKSTFSFKPGIDVTHIAETKGLEYDYVILTEVNRSMYPDQLEARHLLHIGATRAAYQLWVTTSSKSRSPILPSPLV